VTAIAVEAHCDHESNTDTHARIYSRMAVQFAGFKVDWPHTTLAPRSTRIWIPSIVPWQSLLLWHRLPNSTLPRVYHVRTGTTLPQSASHKHRRTVFHHAACNNVPPTVCQQHVSSTAGTIPHHTILWLRPTTTAPFCDTANHTYDLTLRSQTRRQTNEPAAVSCVPVLLVVLYQPQLEYQSYQHGLHQAGSKYSIANHPT
jgi:hypothetical protein